MRGMSCSKGRAVNGLAIGAVLMAALSVLSGCHDRRQGVTTPFGDGVEQWGTKLPYDRWQINRFHPKNLPAVMTFAIVQDGNIDRTTYRNLDPTRPSQISVGKWSKIIGNFSANYNVGNALPVSMHFCWDSVIDKQPYETLIWFGRETWQQMTTRYAAWEDPKKPFWRSDVIIGLAPGGVVRVWLSNQGDPAVMQRGARISTVAGDKRRMCKGITQHPYGYVYYGGTPDFIKGKTYPYGEW